MRHSNKNKKFGRVRKVRTALVKSLAYSLILKEKIRTTDAKARALRPTVEKMITLAKKSTLSSHRLLISRLGSEATTKLIKDIMPRFAERKGGYIRITKLPQRSGDASPMAYIELVQ